MPRGLSETVQSRFAKDANQLLQLWTPDMDVLHCLQLELLFHA